MLQLTHTELYYTRSSGFLNKITGAVKQKLVRNIGVINPDHIEMQMIELKKFAKTKSAASPVLLDAINLYEGFGGRIQLFNLSTGYSTSDIPSFFPFMPGVSAFSQLSGLNRPIPTMFMNMYKIGNWALDDTQYENLFPLTDLHAVLESGFIAYKMIIEQKANDILSNSLVTEYLTRIYTKLFYDALIKVPGNLPIIDEFLKDAAKFLIAKFFLVYILEKNENDDTTNNYARIAANATSSVATLKSYENNLGISYSKLSDFLSTLGSAFYNGNPTNLSDFERAWILMYGEGLALAVEYVPYLLHFLFATLHGAKLGGMTKLDKRRPLLEKEGLLKLYNAFMAAITK